MLSMLVVVLVVNTATLVVLVVLTLHGRDRASAAGPRPPLAGPPPQEPGPTAVPADPLAGAINAFLGRSEGLFRAGGSPAPSPPLTTGAPGPAIDRVATAGREAGTVEPVPAMQPAPPLRHPSRYVPSGPRPESASPASTLPPAGSPGPSWPSAGLPVGPSATGASPPGPRRPASRLDVGLAPRSPADPVAVAAATARLGPVVGGLLHERTRAGDSVASVASGRFSAVLPGTSIEGAEALAARLLATCDAWLAAETPALRLDLALTAVPGGVPAVSRAPDRGDGPERRRQPVPDG